MATVWMSFSRIFPAPVARSGDLMSLLGACKRLSSEGAFGVALLREFGTELPCEDGLMFVG